MERFRAIIHSCGLIDLGYVGYPFTWSRNHPTKGCTHIRLDHALATATWRSKFPRTKVHHVAMSTSNHFVSHPFPHLSASPTTYLPPFRFKPMWLWDPRCDKFVQDEWLEGLYKPNGAHVTNCLDNCRDRLKA